MACVIDWGQFAVLYGILSSAKILDTNAFWPMDKNRKLLAICPVPKDTYQTISLISGSRAGLFW